MHTTIGKWGNSLALRLPEQIAKEAKVRKGTPIDIVVKDGVITIRPTRRRYTLDELLEDYDPKKHRHGEVDWGEPVGREVW